MTPDPQAAAAGPTLTALKRWQPWIGAGVVALGAFMAWGASAIPGDAGYAGVGPNFLPWAMALALVVCGVWLIVHASRGEGWHEVELPSGAGRGDWRALAWVLAGVVVNASLITRIGFVLANTLCYMLAVRGLRLAEGRAGGLKTSLVDALVGLAIAAPVYWLFSKLLAINLPALLSGGWI